MACALIFAVKGGVAGFRLSGSKSTFTFGPIWWPRWAALRTGDVIGIEASHVDGAEFHVLLSPVLNYGNHWDLAVIWASWRTGFLYRIRYGHVFATDWKIHFNSSRTGVRLVGPDPVDMRNRRR